MLEAFPDPEEHQAIDWHCPECGDKGLIRGCEGAVWDGISDGDYDQLS